MQVLRVTFDWIALLLILTMASNSPTMLELHLGENFGRAQVNLFKLPKDLREISFKELERMLVHSAKSISFLVAGRTGAGKSTFINGVLGMRVGDLSYAAESDIGELDSCTIDIEPFVAIKEGVEVTVWDTRGLLDDSTERQQNKNLKDIKRKCSGVSLKLFCIDMSQTRFTKGTDNSDVRAMLKITNAFGVKFWENALIVLTFANKVVDLPFNPTQAQRKTAEEAFTKKLESFRARLRTILREVIGVPQKIVESLPITPAGLYDKWQLPDRDYWLSDLWFQCLYTLPTPEAQGAMIKITLDRLKLPSEVTAPDQLPSPHSCSSEQPQIPPEQIPIIVPTTVNWRKVESSRVKDILTVLGCAAGGGVSGATIGLAALAVGPLGAAIGIPAGAVMGFCIGLALGVHKIQQEPTNTRT